MTFNFRALEMHGQRMWQRQHIVHALDFIQAHDMTALVLHESDIIHQLVFPRAWFDPYAQWKRRTDPPRRERVAEQPSVFRPHSEPARRIAVCRCGWR